MTAELALRVLGAALATVGFGVLLNSPRRALPWIAVVGMGGQLASLLLVARGYAPEMAAFAGGLSVGLLAEAGARWFRVPVTVFTITGFMPLVPGTLAFRAVQEFLDAQTLSGLIFTVRTLLQGGAIAAGLGLGAALSHRRRQRTPLRPLHR